MEWNPIQASHPTKSGKYLALCNIGNIQKQVPVYYYLDRNAWLTNYNIVAWTPSIFLSKNDVVATEEVVPEPVAEIPMEETKDESEGTTGDSAEVQS